MPSAAREQMSTLLNDAMSLGETGNHRPNSPYVRAALVVLCTAWETYIEDVIEESISAMTKAHTVTPDGLAHGLRNGIAETVKKDNPWRLADDGWRGYTRDYVKGKLNRLNTPSAHNAEELLSTMLGIDHALDQCSWPNQGPDRLREYLNELIEYRGRVAHRGTTPGDLNTRGIRNWVSWLTHLADQLDDLICNHIQDCYALRLGNP